MPQEAQTPAVSKTFATPIELYRALARVWSTDTSSPIHVWSATNPALNHCSVTALIAQDYFGGEILTTHTSGGTHFYNLIEGKRWDLTISQFAEPIPFDDTRSSREAAFADTSRQKYEMLKSRLAESLLK
ncbi:YunG family protein [Paraburkholderia sp. HP33-1]|uniref:YunG family protein n=1 Tax=Paraburkholderia sp. HP33-1 TaxID=2883243 RepID=UPI001F429E69|nr:hypothetical protein [Paraburkholderia sp. HP33-1]